MDTHTGDDGARRWVPIDQLLSAIDEDRIITFRPRARVVDPVDDDECYRVNPPEQCSRAKAAAGLPRIHRQAGRTSS